MVLPARQDSSFLSRAHTWTMSQVEEGHLLSGPQSTVVLTQLPVTSTIEQDSSHPPLQAFLFSVPSRKSGSHTNTQGVGINGAEASGRSPTVQKARIPALSWSLLDTRISRDNSKWLGMAGFPGMRRDSLLTSVQRLRMLKGTDNYPNSSSPYPTISLPLGPVSSTSLSL